MELIKLTKKVLNINNKSKPKIMKQKLSFLLISVFTSTFLFSTNFTINTQGMTFVPSSITITAGDTGILNF